MSNTPPELELYSIIFVADSSQNTYGGLVQDAHPAPGSDHGGMDGWMEGWIDALTHHDAAPVDPIGRFPRFIPSAIIARPLSLSPFVWT